MTSIENPHVLPPPSRTFYLSNPRSAEIRSVCGMFISALDGLLYKTPAEHERTVLNSQVELANGMLIALGIDRNMHVTEPKQPLEFF